MILQWDECFDIGSDTLTGVNDVDYQPPFPLTAKLDKLTIKVDRPELTGGRHQEAREYGGHRGGRQADPSPAGRAALGSGLALHSGTGGGRTARRRMPGRCSSGASPRGRLR